MTLSDNKIFNDTDRVWRGFFATAECLVKLTANCHFSLEAAGSLDFCRKIINSIYWLDIIVG